MAETTATPSLFLFTPFADLTDEDQSFLSQRDRFKGQDEALDYALGLIERWLPSVLEKRAAALVEYGNALPDGVTTEAFAEAELLRTEAARLRG